MTKQIVSITNSALKQMRHIISSNNCKSLLLSIKGGGCNGFNYQLQPNNQPIQEGDEVVTQEDVTLHVCGKSMIYLLGTQIDWQNDIMGSCFTFQNPKATSQCGCGTSFGVN